jgi:hypothetical protein
MFLLLEDMVHIAFSDERDSPAGWSGFDPDYPPGAYASDSVSGDDD